MPVDMIQFIKVIVIDSHISGKDSDAGIVFPVLLNNQINGFRHAVAEEEQMLQLQRVPGYPGVVRIAAGFLQQA